MWTYHPVERAILVLYGAYGCIDTLVACLFIFHLQCCVCKASCSNNSIKSTFSSSYDKKKICLDNAWEFTSQSFDDYCMSIRITIEHLVAQTHTQNRLAESFIKRLKLIARRLLTRTELPYSA